MCSHPRARRSNAVADSATRELARRLTGTLEVTLHWQRGSDRLYVSVHGPEHGDRFQLEVAPSEAMDAFQHPYAYASARGVPYRGHDHAGRAVIDV